MEGIQTIQALKAVQSSLPAQTTIPSDELVMLYAADGTPIAKIARDDLVKAVASVMASNSQNTFSKLLGVQANGTPMGIGASDLASVLGGQVITYSKVHTDTDPLHVKFYVRCSGIPSSIVLCLNRVFYSDANGAAIIVIGRADVAIDGNVLCKVGNINVTISQVNSETLLVDCDNTGVSGENAFGILAIKALSRVNQVSVYQ